MRICVFGAGAIGGLVGARLAAQGDAEVSLIARGAHLAVLRDKGLTLKSEEGETTVTVRATDQAADLGAQ
ncbi:oxidoreductase, partial [Mesorhizobium sp. M2A.F.Ca.ET.037.01.1.1]